MEDNKICFFYLSPKGCKFGDKCELRHEKLREYVRKKDTEMKTKVVNSKKENFDVYIGRPSKWGNPFKIDEANGETREKVIKQFEEYLLKNEMLLREVRTLKGKKLGCSCAPMACHGDVLLKYADLANEDFEKLFN